MRLTVFTPTYNRRELLTRAYKSLTKQTIKDFEWLIVDDGSTDHTDDEVKKWIDDGIIHIRYHYRENGGKMRAHNTGVGLADTELFLCLDSDDYLVENAVEFALDFHEVRFLASFIVRFILRSVNVFCAFARFLRAATIVVIVFTSKMLI